MGADSAIYVQDLHKAYVDGLFFRKRFEALKGVTFEVGRGEVFGLLGPNGAGKTTFIKILLGIVRKSAGEAMMLGRPAGDRIGRRQVGYLPENLRMPRHHNALTAMEYYGRLGGLTYREARDRRMTLIEKVGLKGREKDSIKKYSKGMLQRLGLAQALMRDPHLLILDEPTDGLDPRGRSEVRQVISQLAQEGKTVFLNSHILQEVELVCDRVAILDRGELKRVGAIDEISPDRGEGLHLQLALDGPEDGIADVLRDRKHVSTKPLANGLVQVVTRLAGQSEVDALVDALRAREISIVDLTRHRLSLEDVFLDVVKAETDN